MRIRDLILDKYGPFSAQSLRFRPDAKLHIVFGPNEAGKSSALAAITDLLFKIEPRTQYDFLHKAKDLRLGGVIEARNGSRLSFQRRKGNKDTLLDASGAPIPDESLLPFLGTLTREVFTHAFGLNTETLRQGAEEMLKTGGEIGATLFAAASGLRGMTDIRHRLENEAEAIFATRAAKDRRFYQILDRHEAARRQIRDLELKASDWQALNDEIDGYSARLEEIATKRAENSAERARLSRLKRVAPLVRLIDADLAALQTVGILPQVASDFTNRLQVAIDSHREATSDRTRALEDQEGLELELSGIEVDEALLVNAAEIQSLVAKTGAYEKDQRDIPRIQAEADNYSAELKQVAIRLGIGDGEHVLANQPADTACVAVQCLISEGKKLTASLERCTTNVASETETLGELERQRATREAIPNPRHLRDKLTALGLVLKQLDRRAEIERALIAEKRSIEGAAARLHPPVADLAAIARAPLSSAETITRFRLEHDRFTAELQRANEHVAELADAISEIEKRLQSYQAQGPVPSQEAIAAERQDRDKAWVLLRDSMLETTPALTGAVLTGTIVAFEQHRSEADRLADSAIANAELVARHAAEVAHLTEQQAEQISAGQREATLKKDYDHHVEAWKELWRPAGIDPLPPLEMAAWLSQVQALVLRLDRNNTLADELAQIDAAVAGILPALEAVAVESGISRIEGLDANALVAQIHSRLAAVEKLWDDSSKLETSIGNSQSRITKLRGDSAEVTGQLQEWQSRWAAAVPGIGLTPMATIEQAEVALAAWQKVPDILRERDNRQRRVAGMQRDSNSFEDRARAILTAAADLSSLPIEVAVKKLNERLSEATNAKARRDQVAKRLEKATRTLEAANKQLEEVTAELNTLTAAVPPDTDLLELLGRFSRRDEINKTLADHRDQLIAQGEGFTEGQLRTELAEFRVDEAAARLQQLSQEDSGLEDEARDAFANQKLATNRRAELYRGVGAELANQQKKNAEAELLIAARDWTILKFGALLIGRAIEKARGSQHSPLISRAGELFFTITGGSFVGVAQDFGEDDTPYLAGRRASQELVGIPGLSEGARDQLYLALRLAYIEEFAKKAEPVPFIGDDLFTSFDENRTANGLLALAAIGEQVQPILFTHHRHVVDIARKKVGESADIIEMG